MLILKLLRDVRVSGEGYRAVCPFCGHQRAFLFNTSIGVFKCFKCRTQGGFRKIFEQFNIPNDMAEEELKRIAPLIRSNSVRVRYVKPAKIVTLPEIRLALFLEIESGVLPFNKEFIKDKILYDPSEQRLVFPIRDKVGNLIAVSGRAMRPNQWPRYKVYKFEEVKDYVPRNRQHLYLYNLFFPDYHFGGDQQLILVEGYKAALWLVEKGFRAVALQGSQITRAQAELINETNAKVIIFLDNEIGKQLPRDNGECDAITVQQRLNKIAPIAVYPVGAENKSPDDLTTEQIQRAIEDAHLLPNIKINFKWKRKQ